MPKDKNVIRKEGIVTEALPGALFRIKLDSGQEVLGHLSGRMRIHRIRLLLGDRVLMEFTPYDQHRCRIIHRL